MQTSLSRADADQRRERELWYVALGLAIGDEAARDRIRAVMRAGGCGDGPRELLAAVCDGDGERVWKAAESIGAQRGETLRDSFLDLLERRLKRKRLRELADKIVMEIARGGGGEFELAKQIGEL